MCRDDDHGMDAFAALLHDALIVTAVLALPVLAMATLVGGAVAVLQAATQVQEQTLSLLPKIIVVGGMVALGGAFGMHLCAQLFGEAIDAIPAIVHASERGW
jgi:flagellar biosynthetic protein FliQ